ncbi:Rho GTPase activating protein with PAK-box/P21-Rho-binding domain-containing protein [Perilla frutescens var. hirtella]|nr:Rho GTPase activating protein with PAK-box/P21-Rho-binding domain-containing protein [Perilla frutescens var. hirtella]
MLRIVKKNMSGTSSTKESSLMELMYTVYQVMHCNTEEECAELVKLLAPTEAALLDCAINLMADAAQHEHHNKMNARNIAMVFAPNMTQVQL